MPSTCTQPNRCRLGYLTHVRVLLNFAFRARSKLNRVWDQTCSARLLRHLIFHRVLIGRYTNTRRSNVQAVTSPKSNFASHRPWHVWSLARLPRSARVARPFSPFFSLQPSPISPPSPPSARVKFTDRNWTGLTGSGLGRLQIGPNSKFNFEFKK